MEVIVVAITGISLLLLIGGLFTKKESIGGTLILLGIVGVTCAIILDSIERENSFYGLYGRQAENQQVYSSDYK